MLTADTITDEQIKHLQSLDLCARCNCGLLAPVHHNDLMDNHHAFETVDNDVYLTALYEREYPTARRSARARCAEALNARDNAACLRCGCSDGAS